MSERAVGRPTGWPGDPRNNDNSQRHTDRQFGKGIVLDAQGRADVALDPNGSQFFNQRGQIAQRFGAGLETVSGSPTRTQVALADDSMSFTSDGRVRSRPSTSQVRNDTDTPGASLREVLIATAATLAGAELLVNKDQALGYLGADAGGLLPEARLPVTAVVTTDARMTNARAPTGAAGGDLSGTYPNPSVQDDSHSHSTATLTGLGTLATQNGTFSGTSSGTNTGDQTNISGNAATVTTNANLTGPITSSGNATAVGAQTGTGSTFVMQASPAITTPTIASFANSNHTHQNSAGGGTLDAAAVAAGTMATARLGSGSASSSTFLRGDQTWAAPSGSDPSIQVLTSGTTYTPTAGTIAFLVEVLGGGGGGGGAAQAAVQSSGGGGGGSGSYARKLYTTAAASYTYAIGAAGAAGTAGANDGGLAGDTTFDSAGTPVVGKGGGGGKGSAAGTVIAFAASGTGGPVGTGGDLNCIGTAGQIGMTASATAAFGGSGAGSHFGGGAAATTTERAGFTSGNYGGGGSGGCCLGGTQRAGGAGSQGVLVITEWH